VYRLNAGNRPPALGDHQSSARADALEMATQVSLELANADGVHIVFGVTTTISPCGHLPIIRSQDSPFIVSHRTGPPRSRFSGTLYRIQSDHRRPCVLGRTRHNRFDAPDGEFGVLYASEGFNGAFIESFGDAPHVLSVNSLAVRGIAHVQTLRTLHLVDLAGPGLSQLALDARISAEDHALPQQWSQALWVHPQHVDGL
jgi:hypothetical protein